jgi:hypothetical protein
MPFLADRVLDNGLTVLDLEATHVHLCSAEPATWANVGTLTLGNAACSIGAPAARPGGGRQVTVAAIANTGTVTAASPTTATHYAVVDQTNSRLLAAAPLVASQTVTGGNTFSLAAFAVGIPAAV